MTYDIFEKRLKQLHSNISLHMLPEYTIVKLDGETIVIIDENKTNRIEYIDDGKRYIQQKMPMEYFVFCRIVEEYSKTEMEKR